jgi:hypothetical protein
MTRIIALLLAAAAATSAHAESFEIAASPITVFLGSEPERRDFGQITFRGGLELTSANEHFGGLSSLRLSPDGARLTATTDKGFWLTAKVETTAGRPTGLTGADIRPIPRPGKDPRVRTRDRDVEGMDLDGNIAWISMERSQRLHRLDLDGEGRPIRATPMSVPKEISELADNAGVEAVVRLRAPHPYAGALLMIAEQGNTADDDHPAWLVGGAYRPGGRDLTIANRDGYAITDAALLPAGDILVLERRYRPPFSLSMRIRRITGADILPSARLDGEVLLEAFLSSEIDNMEGIAVHQDQGATVVSLISDDNFQGMLQRTLLLQFELKDD